jgi:hypothetical protein
MSKIEAVIPLDIDKMRGKIKVIEATSFLQHDYPKKVMKYEKQNA